MNIYGQSNYRNTLIKRFDFPFVENTVDIIKLKNHLLATRELLKSLAYIYLLENHPESSFDLTIKR